MAVEWAECPEIDKVEHMRVLAQYGLTMEYVHGFEHTLKMLYVLSKVQFEAGKAPLTEEEFRRFLSEKGMIDPTLKNLRKLFDEMDLDPLPKNAEEGLKNLRQIRNWLAHSYLIDNSRVLPNPDAYDDLVNELRFFAEAFATITRTWSKLLNIAIEKLGEGTRKEIEENLGPVMDEIQRQELRKRVKTFYV